MKLVIATPLYPPEIGGPATYVQELEDGLPSHGIQVGVVKFSDVRKWPKFIRHYLYFKKVLASARSADVILALDPVSVGLPAMRAAQKLKKPFIVKIVGDYAWEQGMQRFGVTQTLDEFVRTLQPSFFVRKLQELQTEVARGATRIIVPSQYLKEIVCAWGIPAEKISVIYNGVELPESIPEETRSGGEFTIVSAGRRVPWKGFEAIERVAQKHEDWNVFIASGVSRVEALGKMKTADVFVLNSRYEGFSHALIEAMKLGVPVVATKVGGNTELVGDAGILIPVGDDAALEQALRDIRENPTAARDRASAAQKRIEQFSLERMLDATARLLTQSV